MAGSNNYATILRYFSADIDGSEKIRRDFLPDATPESPGVVITVNSFEDIDENTPGLVPSAKAIKDYLADHTGVVIDNPDAIPNATTEVRGLARLAANVDDTPDDLVVPVGLLREVFFDDEGNIKKELLPKIVDIKDASTTEKGIVQFVRDLDEDDPNKAVSSRLIWRYFFDENDKKIRLDLLPNVKGDPGKDGGWYTPSVSADGTLSWSNNCDASNPPDVNLHGRDGVDGEAATVEIGNVFWQTGKPRTLVKVANVGTARNAVFEFDFEFAGHSSSESAGGEGGGVDIGDLIYTNKEPATNNIGAIKAGWTPPEGGISVLEMLYLMTHEFLKPTFSAFALVGQATVVEVGVSIPANLKFSYSVTEAKNIEPGSIQIVETTANNKVVASNIASSPVMTQSTGYPGSTSPQTKTFVIKGTNTKGEAMATKSVSISSQWRIYWGETSSEHGSEAIIKGARASKLAPNRSGTLSFSAGGFKFFCYPKSFGAAAKVVNPANNFDIALCEPEEIEVTNDYGVKTVYLYYRSYNILGDAINFAIS